MNKKSILAKFTEGPFVPHPRVRNGHAQTIISSFMTRQAPQLLAKAQPRHFETMPATQVLGDCAWQDDKQNRPTLVLLHGMEGSIDSGYMQGSAEQALRAGFNVVRLNHRN